MTFRVLSTNHTSFTVTSLDRTVAFFQELGFELTSRGPRDPDVIEAITGVPGARVTIAFLRGPGHNIELIEYSGPDQREIHRPRPCDVGFAHVGYDVEGIDAAIAAAARHGFKPIAAPYVVTSGPNTGKKAAYLRDPDGLTIEMLGY
jgi:catechol 2,3-dioxygenase-like lactoylglutathione lyase family enzyme